MKNDDVVEDWPFEKGKILILDDDKRIRSMIGRMLKAIGFQVHFAKDHDEAMTLYRIANETRKPFDAVLIDFSASLGGQEAIEKLVEMDPEVRAIVSSCKYDDPVMVDFRRYGFSKVIPKPYSIVELSCTLGELTFGIS